MIHRDSLYVGMPVEYRTEYKSEKGRVKSWNETWVFVVYKCGGDWENFDDYTGCATSYTDLFPIEAFYE